MPKQTQNSIKAQKAWGDCLPDFVQALAEACDKSSQRQVGRNLGLSCAAVNLLINNRYHPRPYAYVKERIRKGLMVENVFCPVLSEIPRLRCLEEQRAPFSSNNPLRLSLYRACPSCPHYMEGKNEYCK